MSKMLTLTRADLLAPLIAERTRLRAIETRTDAENVKLRLVIKTINHIRGVDDNDVQDELEAAYGTLRDIETLTSWGNDDAEKEARSEAWASAVVRLLQAKNDGDLLVDASTGQQPTEARLRGLLRRFADGRVAHAPEQIVERAHELAEQHFDMVIDDRPSEVSYAAEAASIDASTSMNDLEDLCRRAKTIGERIEQRRQRRAQA